MIALPELTTHALLAFRIRDAITKARRLYPGPVGETIADEIRALENLRWLGPTSRPAWLLVAIEALDEENAT